MNRYYFHIRDGRILVPDEEGPKWCNMLAVHEEARASARDLANAALRSSSPTIPATVEVEDEEGNAMGITASKCLIN
jgi:hypothetical protein